MKNAIHFDTIEDAINFSNYLKEMIRTIEDARIKANTHKWLPEKITITARDTNEH